MTPANADTIKIDIPNLSGREAVKAIKEAIEAARVVMYGPGHQSDVYENLYGTSCPLNVRVQTTKYSRVAGASYDEITEGNFPVKSLGNKYVEIGYDFAYSDEHGGWNKVELKGVTHVEIGHPTNGKVDSRGARV